MPQTQEQNLKAMAQNHLQPHWEITETESVWAMGLSSVDAQPTPVPIQNKLVL